MVDFKKKIKNFPGLSTCLFIFLLPHWKVFHIKLLSFPSWIAFCKMFSYQVSGCKSSVILIMLSLPRNLQRIFFKCLIIWKKYYLYLYNLQKPPAVSTNPNFDVSVFLTKIPLCPPQVSCSCIWAGEPEEILDIGNSRGRVKTLDLGRKSC